jgi:surface-anchored protein
VPRPGLVTITPTARDGTVSYQSLDAGLDLLPASMLADRNSAVGVALKPGTYRVRVRVVKHDTQGTHIADPVTVTVVVSDGSAPVVPTPTPAPAPAPKPAAPVKPSKTGSSRRDLDELLVSIRQKQAGWGR